MIRTIDQNDLAYVIERFGNPRRFEAAPLSIYKKGVHKGKKKINPHVSSFIMKDGRTVSVFHVKPVYYLHVNGEWRPLGEVTTHHGNRKIILNNKWEQIEPWYLRWLMKRCELIGGQLLIPWRFDNVPIREGQEIFFTVTTVYPDPDVEVTSVDGVCHAGDGTQDWATVRGLAGSDTASDTAASGLFIRARKISASDFRISRSFFLFDTSSITDTDTIDSAIFSLAASLFGVDNEDTGNIDLITTTPNSNTAIVTADYDQVTTTLQATSLAVASWTDTDLTYNNLTLNATGLGSVSKTGITKFGTRSSLDTSNTEPTGVNQVGGYYADQAGTTVDPKLAVTHTAAAAGHRGFNMTGFWGA